MAASRRKSERGDTKKSHSIVCVYVWFGVVLRKKVFVWKGLKTGRQVDLANASIDRVDQQKAINKQFIEATCLLESPPRARSLLYFCTKSITRQYISEHVSILHRAHFHSSS